MKNYNSNILKDYIKIILESNYGWPVEEVLYLSKEEEKNKNKKFRKDPKNSALSLPKGLNSKDK